MTIIEIIASVEVIQIIRIILAPFEVNQSVLSDFQRLAIKRFYLFYIQY